MVLHLEYTSQSLGVLLKITGGPYPKILLFGVVDEDSISTKFLGDALGLGTALKRRSSVI